MRFIWATRGLTWGFRFLRRGGFDDPLPQYSAAFADLEGVRQVCNRLGEATALRFDDPLGRTDRAGRIIPHEFVVFDNDAEAIDSLPAGIGLVWPLVEEEYARDYGLPEPRMIEG